LLHDKGWSFAQIAEALLLSEDTVRHHFNEYKAWNKLKPENGGSVEKLSAEPCKHLKEHLNRHTYLYVKDITAHVEISYTVKYSIPGMRNWLPLTHTSKIEYTVSL
jgi:transposase